MTLRVTDFLGRLDGEFEVVVLGRTENGTSEILLHDTLFELKEQCDKSFSPLDGFDNEIWEKEVVNFKIRNTRIFITVQI